MIDWQRLHGGVHRQPRDQGGVRSLALHPLVLALFVALAVPLLFVQATDVDVLVVSLLAIPGYVALSLLAGALSLLGVGDLLAVGTVRFYVLHAGWSYLVALATVGAGRAIVRRLGRLES